MERSSVRTFSFVLCLLTLFNCFEGIQSSLIADEPENDISRFFKDVVDAITGNNRRRAPRAVPMAVPVQPVMPVPKDEAKLRQQRLEAYLSAAANWVDEVCDLDADQSAQLQEFLVAHVTESQEKYAKNHNAMQMQKPLADFAPIKMTLQGGAGFLATGYDWKETLKAILTDEQIEKWEETSHTRKKMLIDAQIGNVINLIDDELFITVKQREKLHQDLATQSNFTDELPCLYALHHQNYYLEYQSIDVVLRLILKDGLTDNQRIRLKDLVKPRQSGPDSEQHMMFSSTATVDGWYKQLDEALEKQQERLQRAANVRVDYFAEEVNLTDAERRRLEVASKGAVLYALMNWKEQTIRQIKQFEEHAVQRGNLNFNWATSTPKTSVIQSNQIWQEAVSGISSGDSSEAQRERSHREAEIKYIVALLDQELWFTDTQRVEMEQLIDQKLSDTKTPEHYYYIQEVILIAMPLVNIDEKELQDILDEPQLEAWSELKSQFRINGQNVTIDLRNRGQLNFQVPRQADKRVFRNPPQERIEGR